MITEMVERVSAEIAQLIQEHPYADLPEHRKAITPRAEYGKTDIREMARAAIRATLEPTDETLDKISWHFGAAMMQLPSDDFHDELARNLLSDLRHTALGEDEDHG